MTRARGARRRIADAAVVEPDPQPSHAPEGAVVSALQPTQPVPFVLPQDILQDVQAGVYEDFNSATGHDSDAVTHRHNAANAEAEVTRFRDEIEDLRRRASIAETNLADAAKRADELRRLEDEATGKAQVLHRRCSYLLGLIDRIRVDMRLEPWSVCLNCCQPITRRGSAWGHDGDGFPADCRPGDPDSPAADPVPLPAPHPTTGPDGDSELVRSVLAQATGPQRIKPGELVAPNGMDTQALPLLQPGNGSTAEPAS